jgi:Gram-negative bacterial TonB protein C-terminal
MKSAFFCVAALMIAAVAAPQDALTAAKDLYASAAYEDALAALTRVKETAPELAQQADEYRAFSLFALGRTSEAESVVEGVIRKDPFATPDSRDASPKINEMFGQVRKRLLPEMIRDEYKAARATMDKGQVAGAVPSLTRVKRMLDQAKSVAAMDSTLSDLDVLVGGFLELAKSVSDLANAEAAAKAATPAGPPAAAPAAAAASPTRADTAPKPRIYSFLDSDVVAPVPIRQAAPTIPYIVARTMAGTAGVLEIVINEKGDIESALMREPVNGVFDAAVIAAARSWKYRPAMKEGQAVKYMKRVGVSPQSVAK